MPADWHYIIGWGISTPITIEVYPPGSQSVWAWSDIGRQLRDRGYHFWPFAPKPKGSDDRSSPAYFVRTLEGADDPETARLALAEMDRFEELGMVCRGDKKSIDNHVLVSAVLDARRARLGE